MRLTGYVFESTDEACRSHVESKAKTNFRSHQGGRLCCNGRSISTIMSEQGYLWRNGNPQAASRESRGLQSSSPKPGFITGMRGFNIEDIKDMNEDGILKLGSWG